MENAPHAPRERSREPQREERHDPLANGAVRIGAVAAALRAVHSDTDTTEPSVPRAA